MTERNFELGDFIHSTNMKVGNKVMNSGRTDDVAGGYQLYADTDGALQSASATTGSLVHAHSTDGATVALKATQATATLAVAEVSGTAQEALITSTLVYGAADSLTTKGFLRVLVTSGSDVGTTGYYYIPFGILL